MPEEGEEAGGEEEKHLKKSLKRMKVTTFF